MARNINHFIHPSIHLWVLDGFHSGWTSYWKGRNWGTNNLCVDVIQSDAIRPKNEETTEEASTAEATSSSCAAPTALAVCLRTRQSSDSWSVTWSNRLQSVISLKPLSLRSSLCPNSTSRPSTACLALSTPKSFVSVPAKAVVIALLLNASVALTRFVASTWIHKSSSTFKKHVSKLISWIYQCNQDKKPAGKA